MPNWAGEERRKNGINAREILTEIGMRLTKIETRFEERWISHDKQADDRQKATCQKLDEVKLDISGLKDSLVSLDKTATLIVNNVNERITKLPCAERAGIYRSFTNQIKVMWGFIVAIVLLIAGEWIRKR